MDSGTLFGLINTVMFVLVTLGLWVKVQHGLKFSKEWLDVAIVFIKAVMDGRIDDDEADAILKEWEEAKNGGKLPASLQLRIQTKVRAKRK